MACPPTVDRSNWLHRYRVGTHGGAGCTSVEVQVVTEAECAAAAIAVSAVFSHTLPDHYASEPQGCFYRTESTDIVWNPAGANAGASYSPTRVPICRTPDQSSYPGTFAVDIDGSSVTATRTDSSAHWDMDLRFLCVSRYEGWCEACGGEDSPRFPAKATTVDTSRVALDSVVTVSTQKSGVRYFIDSREGSAALARDPDAIGSNHWRVVESLTKSTGHISLVSNWTVESSSSTGPKRYLQVKNGTFVVTAAPTTATGKQAASFLPVLAAATIDGDPGLDSAGSKWADIALWLESMPGYFVGPSKYNSETGNAVSAVNSGVEIAVPASWKVALVGSEQTALGKSLTKNWFQPEEGQDQCKPCTTACGVGETAVAECRPYADRECAVIVPPGMRIVWPVEGMALEYGSAVAVPCTTVGFYPTKSFGKCTMSKLSGTSTAISEIECTSANNYCIDTSAPVQTTVTLQFEAQNRVEPTCKCNGKTKSDGYIGGPHCTSIDPKVGTFCYTDADACSDGQKSSVVANTSYSHVACAFAASRETRDVVIVDTTPPHVVAVNGSSAGMVRTNAGRNQEVLVNSGWAAYAASEDTLGGNSERMLPYCDPGVSFTDAHDASAFVATGEMLVRTVAEFNDITAECSGGCMQHANKRYVSGLVEAGYNLDYLSNVVCSDATAVDNNTGGQPSKGFPQEGTFTIEYAVVDSNGNLGSANRTIRVVAQFTDAAAIVEDPKKSQAVVGAVVCILVLALVAGIVVYQRRESQHKPRTSKRGRRGRADNGFIAMNPLRPLNRTRAALPGTRTVPPERWYHGLIDRKTAEERLKGPENTSGAFLVRAKAEVGEFVLSLLLKPLTGSKVMHYTITIAADRSAPILVSRKAWGFTGERGLSDTIGHMYDHTGNGLIAKRLTKAVPAPHNTELLLKEAKEYNLQQSVAQETQPINDRIYAMVTEESDKYAISSGYTGAVSGLYYRVFKPLASLADVQVYTRHSEDGGATIDPTDQFELVDPSTLGSIAGNTPLFARVDVKDLQDHLPQVDDIYASLTGESKFSPYPTHMYQNDDIVREHELPMYEEPLSKADVLEKKRLKQQKQRQKQKQKQKTPKEDVYAATGTEAQVYGTTTGAKVYGSTPAGAVAAGASEQPEYVDLDSLINPAAARKTSPGGQSELPTYENTSIDAKKPKKSKSRFFGKGKTATADATRCPKCKSKPQFCDCDGTLRTRGLSTGGGAEMDQRKGWVGGGNRPRAQTGRTEARKQPIATAANAARPVSMFSGHSGRTSEPPARKHSEHAAAAAATVSKGNIANRLAMFEGFTAKEEDDGDIEL